MSLVLIGKVITFDQAAPWLDRGAIYITDNGVIEAVSPAAAAAPVGYANATRVNTRGFIYPGLIDLHSHLAYNFLPLWVSPRNEPYTRRDQWPREEAYTLQIRKPANALGLAAGKALLKYVEVKALVGGVTAIQGSAKGNRPYEGWLIRNIEFETFKTDKKTVYQSVRTLGNADFAEARQHMADGAAFIYHLAEGTAPTLLEEFEDLKANGCLQPQLVAIHATALGPVQFHEWGLHGGSMVWSPFSNLWFYGKTSNVAAARGAGIRVCLGADWAPSGSKNLLGELKIADLLNRQQLDGAFADRELCEMTTSNPADALGWGDRIGRIKAGLHADLLVTAARRDDPYRSLIESTERDVRLVLVGGRAVYGTPTLMRACKALNSEFLAVGGLRRSVSLVDPAIRDADLTWRQVVAQLTEARRDPQQAFTRALALAQGAEPFRLIPDMPGDDIPGDLAAADIGTVAIPPLDSLVPDERFFDTIERAPILKGQLESVRGYYRPQARPAKGHTSPA